jgi:hypothetical protein
MKDAAAGGRWTFNFAHNSYSFIHMQCSSVAVPWSIWHVLLAWHYSCCEEAGDLPLAVRTYHHVLLCMLSCNAASTAAAVRLSMDGTF